MDNVDIKSLNIKELEDFLVGLGEKKFRAKQIYQWIHQKNISSFDEMNNLSKELRNKLKEKTQLKTFEIVEMFTSKIDGTIKFLFRLNDGNVIESVFMKYKHGNSVCISSQVGCRMGCSFCASTIGGLVRNLTASEMLEQIYAIQRYLKERVSNIVVMGTGEPLDNYDELVKFIRLINSKEGLNISQRNITVSTCGLVDNIIRLADEEFSITLAISLHAPNDDLRKKIMPIAKSGSLSMLLESCKYYTSKTGRRLTFEYSMIKDVNDGKKLARELCRILKGILCHVKLIPINSIDEKDYVKSTNSSIQEFKRILTNDGIRVTIRRELGSDIQAACGQLRKSYLDK